VGEHAGVVTGKSLPKSLSSYLLIAIASAVMTSDCEVQERKLPGVAAAIISRRITVLAMSTTCAEGRCDTQFGHHLQRSLPLLSLRYSH